MSEKYKELLEQYDVKVLSTFRSRGTFQCETEQGLALLKRKCQVFLQHFFKKNF